MKEIEIKILEIDRTSVENKLEALGARKVFDDEIHALYFDFPDKAIKNNGCTLRLRREGPKSVLSIKKDIKHAEAKVREEHEIEVSDFIGMKHLLETIGLNAWLEMKKHRTSYEMREAHLEIDAYHEPYHYIPQFLEIEGPDLETIYACAELLGFTRADCRPWDILQVASYYSEGMQKQ